MLTWTTYGNWLQGDKRGYVKDGKVLSENTGLYKANQNLQKHNTVVLNGRQKEIVRRAIAQECKTIGQKLYAVAVCSNHIHIVTNNINMPIGYVSRHYKNAARLALQENGFVGKLWTRGYDKRYCCDKDELCAKINYVRRHNQK